jgi:hypothetical protein
MLRPHSSEIEMMEVFFGMRIPGDVRRYGQEFLDGRVGQDVRLRHEGQEIFFKGRKLFDFCRQRFSLRRPELDVLKIFIQDNGKEYGKTDLRDWYRCTLCVPYKLFDDAVVDRWLHPDAEEYTWIKT